MYRLVKYFPHCQPAVYCGHSRVNNSSSLLGGGQASYCPSPWIGPRLTCSTFGKTPYLRPIHPEKKKQEWSFLTFEMRQGIDICPGPKKTELCTKCDFRAKICKERFSSDFVFRSSIFTTHWECSICVRGCILAAAAKLSKTNCDFWV